MRSEFNSNKEVLLKRCKSVLSGCRHPKQIEKNGVTRLVSCGRCPECAARKSSSMEYLCKLEAQQSKYIFFYTLTYDELSVPILNVEIEQRSSCYQVRYTEATERRYRNGKLNLFSDYGECYADFKISDEFFENFNVFYDKACPLSSLYKDAGINVYHENVPKLRYIRHSDIQNHLKRLRFKVDALTGERLRYFAVSEYGPTTFRPHFHVLLFFNSDRVAEVIRQCIINAWQLGEVRSPGFVENVNNCVSYVTGYLNSSSTVPDYLNLGAIKPKTYHSKFLGCGFNKTIAEHIYKHPRSEFDAFIISSPAGDIPYRPTPAMQNYLFPRIYGYDRQCYDALRSLYGSYSRLSKQFHTDRVADIVREVLTNQRKHIDLLYQLELIDSRHVGYMHLPDDLYFANLFIDDNILNNEYAFRIYNRVCSALYVSKRFYLIYKSIGISFFEAFERLQQHFKDSEFLKLKNFYSAQEYYLNTFHPDIDKFQEENPHFAKNHADLRTEVFYFNSPNFEHYFENNHFIEMSFAEDDAKYRTRIKHYELNDRNNIFVNVLPKNYVKE